MSVSSKQTIQNSNLTDRKNNQNIITPLPPRKHDLSNKYTHDNSNLNSLQNSVSYQASDINTTNGRNNAYLSSGRHPNSNRKNESSAMRLQSLQDSADPSFHNLPPHPNYAPGSAKGVPPGGAKQTQGGLQHSKSQSHFDPDEQVGNSTATRLKQCRSATKLLDTLKLRPE